MTIKEFAKFAPVTLVLLVLIVGYFGLQVLLGVSPDSPASHDIIKYGGNILPLTAHTEPWRLLSAGFVHVGIMHLLFNGFALYYFGPVSERLLGRAYFLVLFLCCIIGGNLANLYHTWSVFLATNDGVGVAAGASGGIMGLGACLLAISLSPNPTAKYLNRKSLFLVTAINLVIGFAIDGIDNAGHIGGAVTGLIFGLLVGFLPRYHWALPPVLLAGFIYAWWHLSQAILPYL